MSDAYRTHTQRLTFIRQTNTFTFYPFRTEKSRK